ncbi:MAG: hypothetical protein EZS28_013564 [Streblomastix strix]|uniref:Uncharacterized protein n=1 Tax=Streblomastix strix TaxID=222440 RepID=A0A5J4W8E6_9EUKA|nr:MAG: hypothetical protein EZS28_013564 [Streblomastix strix]
MAMIPDIMKKLGLKVRTGMSVAQMKDIQNQIRAYDTRISDDDAYVGVHSLLTRTGRRGIYGTGFTDEMAKDYIELELRANAEGKLITQQYLGTEDKYNVNAGINQPAMDLGSRAPVITEEQINNEIMNDGSQKEKEKENHRLALEYPTQDQEDLPNSALKEDEAPQYTLEQEYDDEARQQQLLKSIIAAENLTTVYDIGALDWGRPPVNDTYGRQPFITHKTGYKYDQFGNPQAYMKIDNQNLSKQGRKAMRLKKNYIPTAQLVRTSTAQDKLAKKLQGNTKRRPKNDVSEFTSLFLQWC